MAVWYIVHLVCVMVKSFNLCGSSVRVSTMGDQRKCAQLVSEVKMMSLPVQGE